MKITDSIRRGVYATAATYLPDSAGQASPRHLIRALDEAIHRRFRDEHLSPAGLRTLREASAEPLGWTSTWTHRTLAAELRDLSLDGLDLAELIGLRYANAAGRIWCHGAYSASRVDPSKPRPLATGLCYFGRPRVNLWVADNWRRNPTVLRARGAGLDIRTERPDSIRADQAALAS